MVELQSLKLGCVGSLPTAPIMNERLGNLLDEKSDMGSKMKPALDISVVEEKGEKFIFVSALIIERFEHHGFGTFLCDFKKGEVKISKEAKAVLMDCSERSGLQGLEFWHDKRIAWGDPGPELLIAVGEMNILADAKEWIKDL